MCIVTIKWYEPLNESRKTLPNVFGDGSQRRSFTYITDLVDDIIRLMLSDTNDPVNIGNPVEITIK